MEQLKMNMSKRLRSNIAGYSMVSPYIIHLCIFVAFPLTFSFILVFHKWNIFTPMQPVGLGNFERLFQDVMFFTALKNTLVFLVIHIPLQIAIALLLAVLLNSKIKLRGMFRAIYFMPVVVSGVVTSLLWEQLYAYETGLLNNLLMKIGFDKVSWLTSPELAMPSIAIMASWKGLGFYVILFLVGLQGIPKYLYEAADIDGAGSIRKFLDITIPSLKNTMVLVVVLSTIGGFSLFVEPYVMTGGGPMNSTISVMLYIYNQAFVFGHMGYAAAIGFFFASIILLVVLIQKKVLEGKD